jgi:hypothetical protein
MSEASKEAPPSIVRDLFDPSPSLRFELKRKRDDGSVEAYPFRCRLLRTEQTIEALEAAQKYAKGRELPGYGEIYNEAQAHEVLLRAICEADYVDKGDGVRRLRPRFVSTQQLRSSLDESECAQMINCYEITKAHYRTTDLITPEDVEKYVDRLAGELSGPLFLGRLDSADWPQLIWSLARLAQSWRPETDPTHSSSPSSSESDPSSSESGTTGFTELPAAQSSEIGSGISLPTDHQLSREQAAEIVKKAREGTEE